MNIDCSIKFKHIRRDKNSLVKRQKIPWILLIFFILIVVVQCQSKFQIINPYEAVNWSQYKQYKANLHTHTTVRGGWMNPQTVAKTYREAGYKILAITDHSSVTYPWEHFTCFRPDDRTSQRIKDKVLKPDEDEPMKPEELTFRDVVPSELGMIAIQGNETSYMGHDVGSYFNDYNGGDPARTLDSTAAKGGITILNHPGRYTFPIKWYADLYKRYPHLVGIEVFNCGNRYPNDWRIWDSILYEMAPVRPIWGFSNDDMHSMRDFGRNWNVFLLREINETEVRKAMENGIFYFVNAPQGQKGPKPSEIKSIEINSRKGYISLVAENCDSITWISSGLTVGHGSVLVVRKLPAGCLYVRAELYGKGKSVVCTQPFQIISSR